MCICLWNRNATLKDTISNDQDIWNNDDNRKLAVVVLTSSIGANLLRVPNTDFNRNSQLFVINIAFTITMLEYYDEALDYDSNLAKPSVSAKYRDLHCSSTSTRRDLLKFYRKRLKKKCKCLKKMHLEARKTQPKLGLCENCKEVKERRLLMVCSKCRISQYCSRKCQIAVSSEHRLHCNLRVRAEQIVANTTT